MKKFMNLVTKVPGLLAAVAICHSGVDSKYSWLVLGEMIEPHYIATYYVLSTVIEEQ